MKIRGYMKRNGFLTTLFTVITFLASTACGTALASDTGTGSAAVDPVLSQSAGGGMELTQTQKLALGIIKLEDSTQPVSAEQARQLVILWKALRNITAEDTAVEAEKAALIKQIQRTLTTHQQQAIEAMELSLSSMNEAAEKFGIQLGGGIGSPSPAQQATREAALSNGGFDPGAMGGGPGEVAGGATDNPQRRRAV